MLVFWREKLVIFAVPKTGTSALEAALSPYADMVLRYPPIMKHVPTYRFNRFLKPFFKVMSAPEFDSVACIREPVSWLGSWYKYRSREDVDGTPNSTAEISFDEFVDGYARGTRPPYSDVGSQARFLQKQDGSQAVTHLFQYEQQDKYIAFLEDRLGRKISLEQTNVSPERPYQMSAKIEEKLRRKAAAEFELWESAYKP